MEENLFLLRKWACANSYKEWWLMSREEILTYQKLYEIEHDTDVVVLEKLSDDSEVIDQTDFKPSCGQPVRTVTDNILPTKAQIVLDCVQSGNSRNSEIMNAIHKYYPDCILKETTVKQYIQKATRTLNSKK